MILFRTKKSKLLPVVYRFVGESSRHQYNMGAADEEKSPNQKSRSAAVIASNAFSLAGHDVINEKFLIYYVMARETTTHWGNKKTSSRLSFGHASFSNTPSESAR